MTHKSGLAINHQAAAWLFITRKLLYVHTYLINIKNIPYPKWLVNNLWPTTFGNISLTKLQARRAQ
ncbi:MAG: hypothetical protein A2147_10920 [Chloroflexi bacterium RBG_16_57_8]|nr:MAG: hypothetical protein A2147_10920 [Chloroflexi bacterium RBG_16_57_8]